MRCMGYMARVGRSEMQKDFLLEDLKGRDHLRVVSIYIEE
jgi:hypothetical protein